MRVIFLNSAARLTECCMCCVHMSSTTITQTPAFVKRVIFRLDELSETSSVDSISEAALCGSVFSGGEL